MRMVEKSIYLFSENESEPISCRIKLRVKPSLFFSEPAVVLAIPDFKIDGFEISRGSASKQDFRDLVIESSDPLIAVLQTDNTGSVAKLSATVKSGIHHGYASPIKIFVRNKLGEMETFLLPVSIMQGEVEKFVFPNSICSAVKQSSKSSNEMSVNLLTGAFDAGWRLSSASLLNKSDLPKVVNDDRRVLLSFIASSAEGNVVLENSLLVELVRNSERKRFSIPIRIFVFE
jgi:predicted cupin superfamily sugar epimerase